MQIMPTIWRDNRPHYITMPSTGKITVYTKRHDTVCAQIHFNISKKTKVKLDKKQGHVHVPKSVETIHESKVTILCNQYVKLTEQTLTINRMS
jgi:hypothetical protein